MHRTILATAVASLTLISVLSAQETSPPPTPVPAQAPSPPLQPDDARLAQIVDLVRAGLSESLIAEHVAGIQPGFHLSTRDLLYLKQNGVPESIIAALMNSAKTVPASAPAVAPTPSPPPAPEPVLEAAGLVLDRGFGKKDHVGKLVISRENIKWVDKEDSRENMTLYPRGIRSITLACRDTQGSSFCFQLTVKMVAGDSFKFEDEERERGGNKAILAAVDALKQFFPELTVVEKTK